MAWPVVWRETVKVDLSCPGGAPVERGYYCGGDSNTHPGSCAAIEEDVGGISHECDAEHNGIDACM